MKELVGLRKTLSETVAQLQSLDSAVQDALDQQDVLILPISDEELKYWAERIRPVRTMRTRGTQYFLKLGNIDLRNQDLEYRGLPREKDTVDLGFLFNLTTFHYKHDAGFCPTYSEVVAQIPMLFRGMVAGFEVAPVYPKWISSMVYMYGGYFIAQTSLFTTDELIWGKHPQSK